MKRAADTFLNLIGAAIVAVWIPVVTAKNAVVEWVGRDLDRRLCEFPRLTDDDPSP